MKVQKNKSGMFRCNYMNRIWIGTSEDTVIKEDSIISLINSSKETVEVLAGEVKIYNLC